MAEPSLGGLLNNGSRPSVSALRSALTEARLRSAENQEALQQAGQRGQELLAEETSLQERLDLCKAEISEMEVSGTTLIVDEADEELQGRGYGRSLLKRQERRKQHEVQRLQEQNQALVEELEEKERELLSRQRSLPPEDLAAQRSLAEEVKDDAQVETLAREVSAAATSESEAVSQWHRESQNLKQELQEAQQQSEGMLSALARKLEAVTAKNALLHEELAAEHVTSHHEATSMEKAVTQIRAELESWKAKAAEEARERRPSSSTVLSESWTPEASATPEGTAPATPSGTSSPGLRSTTSRQSTRSKYRKSRSSIPFRPLEEVVSSPRSQPAPPRELDEEKLQEQDAKERNQGPWMKLRQSVVGLVDEAVLSLGDMMREDASPPSPRRATFRVSSPKGKATRAQEDDEFKREAEGPDDIPWSPRHQVTEDDRSSFMTSSLAHFGKLLQDQMVGPAPGTDTEEER